ncbi:unnamed protein product [Sphagnum tenellum]
MANQRMHFVDIGIVKVQGSPDIRRQGLKVVCNGQKAGVDARKCQFVTLQAVQLDHDEWRVRAKSEHRRSHKMLVHSGNLLRIGIVITSIGTNNVADKTRCKLADCEQQAALAIDQLLL